MSHNSEYHQRITDLNALLQLCQERQIPFQYQNGIEFETKLFARDVIKAVATFKLPKWNYNIAITSEGRLVYDNFGGRWGSMDILGEFTQAYNEKAIMNQVDYSQYANVATFKEENGQIVIELIDEY